jgi:hypothetical protein
MLAFGFCNDSDVGGDHSGLLVVVLMVHRPGKVYYSNHRVVPIGGLTIDDFAWPRDAPKVKEKWARKRPVFYAQLSANGWKHSERLPAGRHYLAQPHSIWEFSTSELGSNCGLIGSREESLPKFGGPF